MTKFLIKTRFSSFEYQNITTENIIKILITVREYKYDNGKYYYYLDYTYHPTNSGVIECEELNGDIVYKNYMTTQMINHLLMDDKELYNNTGNTIVTQYKFNIMKSLSLLWD